MKIVQSFLFALVACGLWACGPKPKPDAPPDRRAVEPPPARTGGATDAPRDQPPAAKTKKPAPRVAACEMKSPNGEYCLTRVTARRSRCRGRRCAYMAYHVVRKDGKIHLRLSTWQVRRSLFLTDTGTLITDPQHTLSGPKSSVLMMYSPGKWRQLLASDLLAPSRFFSDAVHKKAVEGHLVKLAVDGGKPAVYDFKAGKVVRLDEHCQAFGKRYVLISRAAFQKTGSFTVARGTCDKNRPLWTVQSDEAPFALIRNGRRVITRNTADRYYATAHLVTVYDRKGKGGVVKRELRMRDLTKVSERHAPASCKRAICRSAPRITFLRGGKLEIKWPWNNKVKKVNLTRPALLRKPRIAWRAGKVKGPVAGLWRAYKGDPRAKVTILVYGDLQCPWTARLMMAFDDLLSVQRRGVKIVWADFPLAFHKQAFGAGIVAHSVLRQKGAKAYWMFVDKALSNRRRLTEDNLVAWAVRLGAKAAVVKKDLAAKRYLPEIKASAADAQRSGARGTPTVILNGKKIRHKTNFWWAYNLLKPLLGKKLRPVR